MKTPTKIRLVTFSLAFLVLLGGFWLDTRLSLSASSTQLEYVYRRALGDLTGYVTGMQSTLEKARYAGAPTTQTEISAQLLEQSGGAAPFPRKGRGHQPLPLPGRGLCPVRQPEVLFRRRPGKVRPRGP